MTSSMQKGLHAMQALLLSLHNQLDMSVVLFCRQEVPRMLFEAEQIAQLATYVTEMNDPELLCWWGRYNESLGQFDTALEAYQQANDTVALVRLHCHQEDFVAACDVVEKSDSAAAAFMLARQLEATEQVSFPGGIPSWLTRASVAGSRVRQSYKADAPGRLTRRFQSTEAFSVYFAPDMHNHNEQNKSNHAMRCA